MATPRQVIAQFQVDLVQAVQDYLDLKAALPGRPREQEISRSLAEQLGRQLTLDWEMFMHRLLLSRAHLNSARVLTGISQRLTSSVVTRFGQSVAARTTFDTRVPADVTETEALLDAQGFNITFKTAEELSTWAANNLAPTDAIKYAFGPPDREFFNFTTALRNYLSHRSISSIDRLRVATQLQHGPNADFVPAGNLDFVDLYLSEEPANTQSARVVLLAQRMHAIAFRLL